MPSADMVQALRTAILQKWGSTGDWNQGGVDRALELARLFAENGITAEQLGQLSLKSGPTRQEASGGTYQDEHGNTADIMRDVPTQQLALGDKTFGFLGDVNRDNSLAKVGQQTELQNGGDIGTLLGWSSQGHGNMSYTVREGANGLEVVPVWGSSSDAEFYRNAAKIGGTVIGAGMGLEALGLGGSGLTGVDAAMADLSAAGGLNPYALSGVEGLNGLDAAAVGSGAGATNVAGGAGLGSVAPAAAGTAAGAAAAGTGAGTAGTVAGTVAAGAAGATALDTALKVGTLGLGVVGTANAIKQANDLGDIADKQTDLATQQYADQKELLNLWGPKIADLIQMQIDAGKLSMDRSNAMWDDYNAVWKPIEHQYASRVAGFDTPERRAQAAREASGQVASEYDIARTEQERKLIASGVDPSTIATLGAASRAWEAKDRAGASNQARSNIEMQGLNLLSGASNFSRGLPSTANATAATAGNQTSGAQNSIAGLSNLTSAPANASANLLGNAANTTINAANMTNGLIGDLFGAGLKAYGMGLFGSSKKSKHVGKKVDGRKAAEAVEKTPSSNWRYRDGQGDGNTKQRMGPMAEDMAKHAPQVSDGKMMDPIAMLGLHHAAIGGHEKRMKRLERKMSKGA